MNRVLISNDDGIEALGLQTLIRSVTELGEIFVIAPDRERSTVSHALSLQRPLRIKKFSKTIYSIDGTPSDCVNIALSGILKDTPPDLVISGINHGANLGDDVIYSGTVAAAMEAAMNGIPAIAVSLLNEEGNDSEFELASSFVLKIAQIVLEKGLPSGTLLNINIPKNCKNNPDFVFTKMGKRFYSKAVDERVDPRGKTYCWIAGELTGNEDIANSDCNIISEGKITITPIKIDMTDHGFLEKAKGWNL